VPDTTSRISSALSVWLPRCRPGSSSKYTTVVLFVPVPEEIGKLARTRIPGLLSDQPSKRSSSSIWIACMWAPFWFYTVSCHLDDQATLCQVKAAGQREYRLNERARKQAE